SGARAADAVVVAEPEPAEYVKICDVYGAGYFYIPGTETCLRIGGYVRYQASAGEQGSFDGRTATDHEDGGENDTWSKYARLSLRTWTGQETELGTLKTYTETRFTYSNGSSGTSLNFAWIQLGGLRVGADESAFDTFTGYAGNVINDTLVPYGGFETNVIQYYFDAGNGFSAVVSLEQGSDQSSDSIDVPDATIDSYVPNVVGGVKYTQGWGSISGVVAYDSNYEEVAGKVRVDVNVNDAISLFAMFGYGSDNNLNDPANVISAHGRGFYKQWGGNWAWWAGGTYKFNEKTSFNLQVSGDDDKNYGVAANVAYDIVKGFTVTAEVDYDHYGRFDDPASFTNVNWTGADKKNSVGGMLRFQRSF
ncbi:porin, partial [Mesorhizobium sp. B2-4-15]|uniref:porin n=1 Tax=Mesorhizobium sp. B2-4-15 TaxID=2589934 RepID=UPI001150DF1F